MLNSTEGKGITIRNVLGFNLDNISKTDCDWINLTYLLDNKTLCSSLSYGPHRNNLVISRVTLLMITNKIVLRTEKKSAVLIG